MCDILIICFFLIFLEFEIFIYYNVFVGDVSIMHVKEIIYMIVIPFLFVLFIIPFIKKVAAHVGALDVPDARKVHKEPMPRLGGLGIYMGFLLGYIFFGTMSLRMNAILIGSFIIVLTGVVDDIKPLKASIKLIGQLA